MCMMLTGLIYDVNDEIESFPVESEKNYLVATVLAFQIYGDPRGRGNYSIPYFLFFAWKLSLLALAESRKLNDSELAEEMFDSTLASLFNHKRLYRRNQLEIITAQDQVTANMQYSYEGPGNKNFNRQFEQSVDQQEYNNYNFNVKRFNKRPRRIITTAGFTKAMLVNASVTINRKH